VLADKWWNNVVYKSRTKRPRNTKVGGKVVHPTGNSAPVSRSKVKGTRWQSTNAETGSVSYLRTGSLGKPTNFKLVHRLSTKTHIIDKRRDLQGHGRKVTWCVWQVLGCKSRTKRHRNTKIGKKVAHATGNNAHHCQGQGRLMLTPKVYLNSGTEGLYTNHKGQSSS